MKDLPKHRTLIRFIALVTLPWLAIPTMSRAQPPERPHRVAIISQSSSVSEITDAASPTRRAILQALRERGYVEGRTLIYDPRTAEGVMERIPDIVVDLVRLKTDVIIVGHTGIAQIAAKVTTTIPIFSMAGDPLVRGLVLSLNRPGGNINGITAAGTITVEQKRLELLRELVPNMKRVAFVATKEWWDGIWGKSLREAATLLGLQAVYIESKATGLGEAFAVVRREKPDAVYFESSPAAFSFRASIGEFATASRIPSACGHQEVVEAGCLMTYNFTTAETFRAMADFVDRIAKGAKVGELPYHQYTRYEFALNATTAKAIGLTIPPSLLVRVDRVIE
jgi:putative ABC transport system substrate-binding protein